MAYSILFNIVAWAPISLQNWAIEPEIREKRANMKSVLLQSEEKRLLNIYVQILLNFLCLSPAILDGHKLVFMVVRPAHISGEPNSV